MTTTEAAPVQPATAEPNAAQIAADWLAAFVAAVEAGSAVALESLFAAQATWRDFMSLEWDFTHSIGRATLAPTVLGQLEAADAREFVMNTTVPPAATGGAVDAFVDFASRDRVNRMYVHLERESGRYVASKVQTQLLALADYPERIGAHRQQGKVYGVVPGRTRWSDDRARAASFEDSEPSVVVLGAGHNGLSIAARLGALDVPTLVIERETRVGDTWRKRYASLALHSTVWGDHLPYLPMPPTWTSHTPKDKWAEWLESYATLLDLNVWTSTSFMNAHYDEDAQLWSIHVRRPDGSVRELRPRHFVVAGGMYGTPRIPDIKGLDSFTGEAVHSDSFQDASRFRGRTALVVGAGVSGHELAHDLWEQGADVTMLQRSSTYVVSYDAYHLIWNTLFTEEATRPPEFLDQIAYSTPNEGPGDDLQRTLVKLAAEQDKELLDGLQSVGFKLHWGPNGTGIIGARMAGADSFQIDIGASGLIADGSINLKQGTEIAEIDGDTVVFKDGTRLRTDLIVFATGYNQFWTNMAPQLGSAAAKIDNAYVRDDDGEWANTWRRSAQPGLWFGTGFIRVARFYSAFIAMLIKAIEVGIEPIDPNRSDSV